MGWIVISRDTVLEHCVYKEKHCLPSYQDCDAVCHFCLCRKAEPCNFSVGNTLWVLLLYRDSILSSVRQKSQYYWENTFQETALPTWHPGKYPGINGAIKSGVQLLDLVPEVVLLLWCWSKWALERTDSYYPEQKAPAPSHAVPNPSVVLQTVSVTVPLCSRGAIQGESQLCWNQWQVGFGGSF